MAMFYERNFICIECTSIEVCCGRAVVLDDFQCLLICIIVGQELTVLVVDAVGLLGYFSLACHTFLSPSLS